MPANTDSASGRVNLSVGHVSVHVEGAHPAEVPFLLEMQQKRLGPAFGASLASHGMMILAVVLMMRFGGSASRAAYVPDLQNKDIVWLTEPGPGGGGGGGGNRMKEPPRKAEDPGKDKITIPAKKPETPKLAKNEPNPIDQLVIPARTLASATESLPGAIEAPPGPPTISQGPGTGGGAGSGSGTGIGPGSGPGLGPGSGGGTGGGVYQPGNGVTAPIVMHEEKPQYTSEAMRAKIQGVVWVECVVRPDGRCSDVHVTRSLDPVFGLDQEAMKAVSKWRFMPGKRMGEPVSVVVSVELTFTLR
jgi:periplasmic protein TonB